MGDIGLELPIDHRESGHVEHDVGDHEHEDAARDGEYRSEDKTGKYGLFRPEESLIGIVGGAKQPGGDQHDKYFGRHARSKKFAETLEHPTPEESLFPEPGVDY